MQPWRLDCPEALVKTFLPPLTGEGLFHVLEWLVTPVFSTILGEVRLCLTDSFGRVKADNGRWQSESPKQVDRNIVA